MALQIKTPARPARSSRWVWPVHEGRCFRERALCRVEENLSGHALKKLYLIWLQPLWKPLSLGKTYIEVTLCNAFLFPEVGDEAWRLRWYKPCDHLLEKPALYVDEMALFLWDEFYVRATTSSLKRALASVSWLKKVARQRAKEQSGVCSYPGVGVYCESWSEASGAWAWDSSLLG